MPDTPSASPSSTPSGPSYADVAATLLARWPETKLEPSLDRIQALVDLLGDPQSAYEVVHLTGTNGKTSTARMIDALVRWLGLRTGRITSPHVESMTERISIDGEPLSEEAFVRAYLDVAPYLDLVDADQLIPLSFFETVVGMALTAFSDAPVDIAIVEVGMGGAVDDPEVDALAQQRGADLACPVLDDGHHLGLLLGDDDLCVGLDDPRLLDRDHGG